MVVGFGKVLVDYVFVDFYPLASIQNYGIDYSSNLNFGVEVKKFWFFLATHEIDLLFLNQLCC